MTKTGNDAEKRETIADIVRKKRSMAAEIRANLSTVPVRREDQLLEADSLDREADCIEAAWKREKAEWEAARHKSGAPTTENSSAVGNAAAMREALIEIEKMAHCDLGNVYPKYRNKFDNLVGGIERIARAALSAPARQCDVGTPEEQDRRWSSNCGHGIPRCCKCAVYAEAKKLGLVNHRYLMKSDCKFVWAQMPYAEEVRG